MKVVEMGNLGGVEGVDSGVLIAATPEELRELDGNYLYKEVKICLAGSLDVDEMEELKRYREEIKVFEEVKSVLRNVGTEMMQEERFDREYGAARYVKRIRESLIKVKSIAEGEKK